MPIRHALIIEDELIIALGLQSMLSDLGFASFAFASTARQALEQARLQCPDLVTVDVGLLDGDGLEAVDAIHAACGPTPTIYVTGDREALVDRPDAVVLEKPVETYTLSDALARARGKPDPGGTPSQTADRHGSVTGPR